MASKLIKLRGTRDNSLFLTLLKTFIKEKDSHINGNTHNIRYGEYGGYKWNGYEGYKPVNPNYKPSGEKEICFYEWSDVEKEPKTFKSRNAFRSFLINSNIPTTKELEERIDDGCALHACCKKDSRDVLHAYSKYSLKNQLENIERGYPPYNYDNTNYRGCYNGYYNECWD